MTPRTLITHCRPFDGDRGTLGPLSTLVIEGDRIVECVAEPRSAEAATVIDAGGRAALPGLIDAHVHVMAVTHDIWRMAAQPPSLITAQTKPILEGMLQRGFTTVRDAAGADFGLQEAVRLGLFAGPRLHIAARPLTQTGGHADIRPQGVQELVCTCAGLGLFGAIADGDAEVRRAVREQVRNGANQIKIMAGGGVASPTDPIDGTQYSPAELAAICEEAEAANTYVMAHAYSPRSIVRAVRAGVRSIEHGNLLDEDSARVMKEEGAFLVPTLATYAALGDDGARLGWSAAMLAKLERVRHRGVQAIAIARAAGVEVGFGTDLLGHMHERQMDEFALRAEVQTPAEILRGATTVAARLLRAEGQIGTLAAGALADVLLVDGDPTASVEGWANPGRHIRLLMQGGRVLRQSLQAGSAQFVQSSTST
ncbi:MAG: amidohydrolase family protein [Rubrivivax sp.]|nr:amidohydrolase family protein [Rubrivivax sp.]